MMNNYIQNLSFTKQSRNIPQLRFPEFEVEWERKKLGDIAVKIGDG